MERENVYSKEGQDLSQELLQLGGSVVLPWFLTGS